MTMTMATSGDGATGRAMIVTAQDASPDPQGLPCSNDRRLGDRAIGMTEGDQEVVVVTNDG